MRHPAKKIWRQNSKLKNSQNAKNCKVLIYVLANNFLAIKDRETNQVLYETRRVGKEVHYLSR